jgi:type I restriction enzyme S subunit
MSDDYGYPLVPLHQVARRITDGSHFSPTPREHGPLIANVKDMKAGAIDFSTCTRISPSAYRELEATGCTIKNGNVLLSKDGTVGRVVVYRQDDEIGALSSICIIEPTDRLDAAFLGQALQSEGCTRQYDNFMSGSALRRLVLRDIRSIQVPLPDSEHQRAIAQVLDTLDTAIHETEAIIAKLKAVKQGLLHDLLTRGIDANGELRPPQAEAPHLYKQSPLGWIPKEWEALPLEQITGAPICYGIVQVLAFVPNGVPVLAIRDLHGDYTTGIHRTAPSIDAAYPRSRVRPGDVLLSIKGTLGRVGVVPNHFAGNISRDIALIRPAPMVRSSFLSQMLQSMLGQQLLSAAQVGTTRGEISIAPLRRIIVPLPDTHEQQRIECSMTAIETRLKQEEQTLRKLRSQKSGLMDDLLTGRVRVTPLLEVGAP